MIKIYFVKFSKNWYIFLKKIDKNLQKLKNLLQDLVKYKFSLKITVMYVKKVESY